MLQSPSEKRFAAIGDLGWVNQQTFSTCHSLADVKFIVLLARIAFGIEKTNYHN